MIALDIAGQVDFLCQGAGEYRLYSQGLDTSGGEGFFDIKWPIVCLGIEKIQ